MAGICKRQASSPSQSHIRSTAPPKGEPLAKPETLPYCQGLSLWERWHGVSRDGEGKPASKRQIYEKALVFQGENLERREPVKFKLQGTRGTTLFAAPLGTAALHDRLFAANRCPGNGGRPSKPTCVFSSAAQGPVTETLRTALHHPAALCTRKKIVFSPSTHLCFVQSGLSLA